VTTTYSGVENLQ